MILNKRIEVGEYIVIIKYNDNNGSIEVEVLDELEEIIESLTITNLDESDENQSFNPSLN